MMKFNYIPMLFALLLLSGCAGKKVYDERGYLFNPSDVWIDFEYGDYQSYDVAATALKARLKEVWHVRQALGRYTKATTNNVDEIINELVPADGLVTNEACNGLSKGTVVLLHGLYDSPYVMKDIGHFFNQQCYQSRFLLLPGHGTVPGDLRDLKYRQWTKAVKTVVEQTMDEYKREKILIAGFSTGAGLAINYASDYPDNVQALFLFAPLVDLPMKPVFGAALFDTFGEYVQKGNEMDTFKYESVPANSVLQANRLAKMVKHKLITKNLNIPVFIAQAKNDYTLSSQATIDLFNDNAFGSKSAFLLYSPKDDEKGFKFKDCNNSGIDDFGKANKIACNSSFVHSQSSPKVTIDDYSHMSLILSPTDPHYGIGGNYRYCLQYRKGSNLENCRYGGKLKVCYGERDVFRGRHVSKECPVFESVIVRLTSNPKFDHLKTQLANFMKKQEL